MGGERSEPSASIFQFLKESTKTTNVRVFGIVTCDNACVKVSHYKSNEVDLSRCIYIGESSPSFLGPQFSGITAPHCYFVVALGLLPSQILLSFFDHDYLILKDMKLKKRRVLEMNSFLRHRVGQSLNYPMIGRFHSLEKIIFLLLKVVL